MTLTEYTVHFQRGSRIGARSLRMITVEAETAKQAVVLAYKQFDETGYRLTRVDHFDANDSIVIDR